MDYTNLRRIVASAHSIYNHTSRSSQVASPLQTTGRQPVLRIPALSSDVRRRVGSQLGTQCLIAIEDALRNSICRFRLLILKEYQTCLQSLQSSSRAGMEDHEVESGVVSVFEAAFRQHWDMLSSLVLKKVQSHTQPPSKEKVNGFTQRTTIILDTAFTYTQTPTNAEIEQLSRLTGLATHQVRTWFQNRRNRRAKADRSVSGPQHPAQKPVQDGRRVASLPSRAKPTTTTTSNERATRPLPRRGNKYVPATHPGTGTGPGAVPLKRTVSHSSDDTTLSFSSIPSNGGFTGFQYPTVGADTVDQSTQPTQTSHGPFFPNTIPEISSCSFSTEAIEAGTSSFPIDFDNLNLSGFTDPSLPPLPLDDLSTLESMNLSEMEQYLNFNLDNLAPPADDLSWDLEASIQAALRPDTQTFNNLTLAPSPSSSSSSNSLFSFGTNAVMEGDGIRGEGEGSPVSDYSAQEWYPELSPQEAESMEMLKIFLDGMDFVASPMEFPTSASAGAAVTVTDHSSPLAPPPSDLTSFLPLNPTDVATTMDQHQHQHQGQEQDGGEWKADGGEVVRSTSPSPPSGRETPEGSIVTSTSQYSFSSASTSDDLPLQVEPHHEQYHHPPQNTMEMGMGMKMEVDMEMEMDGRVDLGRGVSGIKEESDSEIGGTWMMGVLPFEMAGEWVGTGTGTGV